MAYARVKGIITGDAGLDIYRYLVSKNLNPSHHSPNLGLHDVAKHTPKHTFHLHPKIQYYNGRDYVIDVPSTNDPLVKASVDSTLKMAQSPPQYYHHGKLHDLPPHTSVGEEKTFLHKINDTFSRAGDWLSEKSEWTSMPRWVPIAATAGAGALALGTHYYLKRRRAATHSPHKSTRRTTAPPQQRPSRTSPRKSPGKSRPRSPQKSPKKSHPSPRRPRRSSR